MCSVYVLSIFIAFTGTRSASVKPARAVWNDPFDSANIQELYNPMDPMGFINRGNSQQFTKGNGINTPRFDPNEFSYPFAGDAFQPNFANKNTQPQIEQHKDKENEASTSGSSSHKPDVVNETLLNLNSSQNNSNVPEQSQNTKTQQTATMPQFESQSIPENIIQTLNKTANDMFPASLYIGKPGMLGTGVQMPLAPILLEKSPMPDNQYLPFYLVNVSETRINNPIYDGYPGMFGTGGQRHGAIEESKFGVSSSQANGSDTQRPSAPLIYSGYPGMLGVEEILKNLRTNSNETDGLENKQTANGFSLALPGINANNWKGEWPGKTSDNDWNGAWKNGNADANKGATGEKGAQAQSSSSDDEPEPTAQAPNNLENLSNAMAVLQKMIALLQDLSSNSHSAGHDSTYNAMAEDWAKDVHANRKK